MTKEQLLADIDNLLEHGMVAMVERWELKGINPNIYHAFLKDEVKSYFSSSYDKIREQVLKEVREKVEGAIRYYPTTLNNRPFTVPAGWLEKLEADLLDSLK